MNLELRCNSLNWPSSALTYFFPAVYFKKRWAVWLVARLDGSFSAALVLFLRRRWAACENLSLRSVSCRTREKKKHLQEAISWVFFTSLGQLAQSWEQPSPGSASGPCSCLLSSSVKQATAVCQPLCQISIPSMPAHFHSLKRLHGRLAFTLVRGRGSFKCN